MSDPLRERVGQVLTDYRDGLLDGIEEAVDAIMEAVGAVNLDERDRVNVDDQPDRN